MLDHIGKPPAKLTAFGRTLVQYFQYRAEALNNHVHLALMHATDAKYDGVYESLLDGLELEDLREKEGIDCRHYLIVDAHDTWWKDGKPYLCRIVDMMHMGYVDEVLFGREVIDRLPALVREWVSLARTKLGSADPPTFTPATVDG